MGFILQFYVWFARFLTLIFDKFLIVIAGFFPWLWGILKRFLGRRFENANFLNSLFSNPTYKLALTFVLGTVVGLFLSILTVLIQTYSKVRDFIESFSSGGGGGGSSADPLGLFNQLANSLGIWEVLREVYTLWAIPFINLIGVVCAIIYYKSIMKVLQKAFERANMKNYIG